MERAELGPGPGAAGRPIPADLRRLVDSTRLLSPSKSLILSCGEMDHMRKEKKLEEIVVVNMSGRYLINLGYLTNCPALRICILPRNYITKIDALSNCPNLIKLDLHGNHVTELPDEYFWSDMRCLQVLYLHDNIIGDVNSIEGLRACPRLAVLTLFDTPVSLMPNYRNFVVNNIWSLKALDNFVIADEEVMEDWPKCDKFKALNPQFSLDFPASSQILRPLPQVSTWHSELENIRSLMATVNNILAHCSPVHIIQRWIRGHLTRKKLGATSKQGQDRASCAAVNMCGRSRCLLEDGSLCVEKSSSLQVCRCCAAQLQINELQVKTLQARYEAKEITSGIHPRILERKKWNLTLDRGSPFRHRTIRRPNVTPQAGSSELELWMEEEEGEGNADRDEMLKVGPILHRPDRAREVLLSHWAAGEDVRVGVRQLHEMLRNKPQPRFTYQPPASLDKRLYAKSFGCVMLAPFVAIQKAYGDREKAARQRLRAAHTHQLKATEERARGNLHGQAIRRSSHPLRKHQEDEARGKQVLHQREVGRAELLRLVRQNSALFLQEKGQQALEQQNVREFNSRYTTMSEALLKRQIREKKENIRQRNVDLARNVKIQASQLKGEIREFMALKQLAMHAENNVTNTATSIILSQATKDRLLHARARVAAQKGRAFMAETSEEAGAEEGSLHARKLPGIPPQPMPTHSRPMPTHSRPIPTHSRPMPTQRRLSTVH